MSRIYDNWEKLMGALMRREIDRQLAYCESLSSSSSTDISSPFSFQITFAGDVHQPAAEVSGQKIDHSDLSTPNLLFSLNVRAIEYEEIRKATTDFHDDSMLWEGFSYRVYKGWIDEHSLTVVKPGFEIPVAFKIKQIIESKDIDFLKKKWTDEISHLRHPNLVTPIGYCFDTDQMIFAYEFMPKGSLGNHLFRWGREPLPWATRIQVAVGAAKVLAFLHSLETPVINGNLTIQDILLDLDFNAKLSDVGLPKQVHIPKKGFTNEIEGPFGIVKLNEAGYNIYNAPEFIETGNLSTKCDVYSFGVILLELISGLRALDRNRPPREHNLIDWAKPYFRNKRRLLRIMDRRLEGEYPHKQAWKVAQLAMCCVSSNPRSRPTMADVVAVLQRL